ncbi:phage tail sheath protein [Paenibacillus pinisoli]|uniref:Phage tail sheath protein n=1 Tax=Paenibacillus pinisoli TaxID=1276110 RepID=A0A3A6PIB8_9BACL|nr:phage tail sheath family protein [Paenibacillus pinisoli]RJX40060.1 phage tail sheath protein [Paenibacillus pinisoli]
MAGGTWVDQNKVRPGVYINFKSAPKPLGALGESGITSMALTLPWGAPKEVMAIEAGDDIRARLGVDLTDSSVLLLREALKQAKTVLLYRLNSGTKSSATIGSLTATAKYGGTLGNDLNIVIQKNVDDENLFDVYTILRGAEVDKQTAADAAGLKNNSYVDFSGIGSLTATAGAALEGGTDGTVTNQDHMEYMTAIELHDLNTIAYTGTDVALKGVYTAFVRRLRETEGKKLQLVLENDVAADYEGVISVKNGVVLSDGTTLTAAQATAWVAAATAAAPVNQSLTYSAYDGAVDASPRYTNTQIVAALQAGEFVFTSNQGRAVVEQDINTLTSFTPDKGKAFGKNRVIRVLDTIANDVQRIFESFYIGKVGNNADGRALLGAEIINYLQTLQGLNAIDEFDSQSDISVAEGRDSDSVVVTLHIKPVDAVEKIYISVEVK